MFLRVMQVPALPELHGFVMLIPHNKLKRRSFRDIRADTLKKQLTTSTQMTPCTTKHFTNHHTCMFEKDIIKVKITGYSFFFHSTTV